METEAGTARAQVERLVQSKTFATSEVHRRLLQYLAEKAIAGEADRLKEYTIGLEAFGKPPTYDPKQDSIVRLQIGRLRQKLTAYYQSEANSDELVVNLPKGAFKLHFEGPADRERPSELPPVWTRRPVLLLAAALAGVTAWAVVSTIAFDRLRSRAAVMEERWTPELEELWAPFVESHRPLLICFGAPLFVRLPDVGFFRDPKANDWQETERSARLSAVRQALGGRDILPSYAFTGMGEASAASLISQLLSTRKRLLLARSNTLSWQQIVDNDVVFIGPPKFNPQLQAAALKQDIVIEPNGIRNLKPQPDEPGFLEDHILPLSEGETHALITRIPGLSGGGELLVIAGNASPDTQAAAEWLTEPWRARELVSRLRTASGRLPRYFQVVVKVAFKQGIPVQSSYVFHHVMEPPANAVSAKR